MGPLCPLLILLPTGDAQKLNTSDGRVFAGEG